MEQHQDDDDLVSTFNSDEEMEEDEDDESEDDEVGDDEEEIDYEEMVEECPICNGVFRLVQLTSLVSITTVQWDLNQTYRSFYLGRFKKSLALVFFFCANIENGAKRRTG